MELPILYALTWPERVPDNGVSPFDPVSHGALTFEPVRHEDFPMLGLGISAGRAGGAAPAVFNAANEVAVAQFLVGTLSFGGIADRVSEALRDLSACPGDSLDALLAARAPVDAATRMSGANRISPSRWLSTTRRARA
jgi:1-deoxy-D-xylulose-5-phosphate reductoisomerase